ncbi:MAG: MarR family winged helix-turn-helix transcriptional regulator [Paraglaciecola sp.]
MTDIYKRLETCACFRMRAASRKLTRDYDEVLKPAGIKITQFTVLAIISGTKPHSISSMASSLSMERTSLVRTLSLLEKKELIKLGIEGYRREREISLTPKGEAIFLEAVPLWEKAQSNFEEQLGAGVWQTLWKHIAKLARGKSGLVKV